MQHIIARGSQGGSSGGRPSRGESMAADKAKKEARRGSVYDGERRQSAGGKGSLGGMGKKKSIEMSKESKLKQKKAEEAALRKNKVRYLNLLFDKYSNEYKEHLML